MTTNFSHFSFPVESVAGAPRFTLHFCEDTVRAELAGAALYGEMQADGLVRVRMTAADGEVLADLTLHPRAPTENVVDIASALLWSHWRWVQAKTDRAPTAPYAFPVGATTAPAPGQVMQFFSFSHLPAPLQDVSRPFAELAALIVKVLPGNRWCEKALDKLLEAKDSAVRSHLDKP